ncbi:MAG: cytochrome b N-terminal domain-containing protein [Myxococcales bacterium]|nr:cytochrome b N-terminal domain-containing protein [Myxococcales bacterium]
MPPSNPIETGAVRAHPRAALPIPTSAGVNLAVALLAALLVVALTGVGLSFHYAPTATDAWASTARLETDVLAGALLRSAHHAGATVVIVLCAVLVVHGVATAIWRNGRVGWLALVGLLAVLPLAPMTGNLLPWDETGYWQTQIEATIVGGAPVVGDTMRRTLIGGDQLSSVTLTRYYAIHTLVLPVIIGLCAWMIARSRRVVAAWVTRRSTLLLASVVVVFIFAVSYVFRAPLGAPADPSLPLDVRPEWYFLPLFALRKLLEGPFEVVATLVAPGFVLTGLGALPWLDAEGRHGKRLVALLSLGGIAIGALTGVSVYRDHESRDHVAAMTDAEAKGRLALEYAAATPADLSGVPPLYRGMTAFVREGCTTCHASAAGDAKEASAPDLRAFQSRAWLRGFLEDPSAPKYFGLTPLAFSESDGTGMPGFAQLGGSLDDVVEYVLSLGDKPHDTAGAARGATMFAEHCAGCHEVTQSASVGPALEGYGSVEWTASVIIDPNHELAYGELGAAMPDHPHIGRETAMLMASWLLHEGSRVGDDPVERAGGLHEESD